MNKKDILKSVYNDFFGLDRISRENEKLSREIRALTEQDFIDEGIPILKLNNSSYNETEESKEEPLEINVENAVQLETDEKSKDQYMEKFYATIDSLYIKQVSKELLKKVIEYMRKYDEKVEKQYISFNMCIYAKNKETINKISSILAEAGVLFSYIREGRTATYSLYDLEAPSQLEKAYDKNNNLVIFNNFNSLNLKDSSFKENFITKLDELSDKNLEEMIVILHAPRKEILTDVFKNQTDILEKFADFEVIEENPEVANVYTDIFEKLKSSDMTFPENFDVDLLAYINATYPSNVLPYPDYRDNVCQQILFNQRIPKYEKEKSMDEIFSELNELVGLQKVKQMLRDLVDLIELKSKTKDDLKIKNVNLHMIFLGNPGTGKTTVARIVAEMLYNLKYIKQNKLIEVSSKDLVAEYVGQTAPKTMAVIDKALGGVLFIDEAYSLASGNGQGNSYNEEAIATLIQAMENYRDELVVIFAGYTKEMQDFLNANSGIVSRIGYTIEFDDYTTEELIQIFTQMAKKAGFNIEPDALDKVRELIDEYKGTKNFGNARFVRNIYEKSVIKHASNTKDSNNVTDLKTLTKDDISDENLLKM